MEICRQIKSACLALTKCVSGLNKKNQKTKKKSKDIQQVIISHRMNQGALRLAKELQGTLLII